MREVDTKIRDRFLKNIIFLKKRYFFYQSIVETKCNSLLSLFLSLFYNVNVW